MGLLAVQGGCGCMLHYLEDVLIVIPRVVEGKFSELCEKRICSGTKYSVSWVGCPELLKLTGVKSRGEAILSFVTRAWM